MSQEVTSPAPPSVRLGLEDNHRPWGSLPSTPLAKGAMIDPTPDPKACLGICHWSLKESNGCLLRT